MALKRFRRLSMRVYGAIAMIMLFDCDCRLGSLTSLAAHNALLRGHMEVTDPSGFCDVRSCPSHVCVNFEGLPV